MSFLPQQLEKKSRLAKRSPAAGEEIAACETFPSSWGGNRGLRNVPQQLGRKSRLAKRSPATGEEIAACETFPSSWGGNRGTEI